MHSLTCTHNCTHTPYYMLQHTQVHGDELISDSDDGGLAGAVQVRASP